MADSTDDGAERTCLFSDKRRRRADSPPVGALLRAYKYFYKESGIIKAPRELLYFATGSKKVPVFAQAQTDTFFVPVPTFLFQTL